MTMQELNAKAQELREVQAMIEELTAQADALRDCFKSAMIDAGSDVLTGDGWRASWHAVTSTRLDSKALKAADPETYARYCKQSTVCRFVIT